ncbi:MAG: fatty acid desaturase [Methylococcaceae bacterium]
MRISTSTGIPDFWWLGYSLSLIFPTSLLLFLATGPHDLPDALVFGIPMIGLIVLDRYGPSERRMVPGDAPLWFFDGILYGLALLQILNVWALGWLVARLGWSTPGDILLSLIHLLIIRLMAGPNACCAAICPAHELIHRRNRWQRRLGRLLLTTVCYDHFHVSHKLAHHAHLGGAGDPSTAFRGERFDDFFRRSIRAQWLQAWKTGPNRALQGVVVELGWVLAQWICFGPLAAAMFLNQAYHGVRVLEAVNYFQHYGLTCGEQRPPATAWRNDSATSLFLFIGLTRHADHHLRPGVPYPRLRILENGPLMSRGYLWTAMMVLRRDGVFRVEAEQAWPQEKPG